LTTIGLAATPAFAQITTRESVDSAGTEANDNSYVSGISSDGNFIAFYSYATNLVAGDTNHQADAFVRDRTTGTVTRVSLRSSGTQGNGGSYSPVISADGTIAAFYSDAKNLVANDLNLTTDVFVHDLTTGTTTRVSVDSAGAEANGASFLPVISADGTIVAFQSSASNLVAGDTNGFSDVFVHDLTTATTTRISVDSTGAEGNNGSYSARISANGQFIFFYSDATNLVAGDTNGVTDAFVYDRATGITERVSVDSAGNQGDATSFNGTISQDGALVAFYSLATNLVAGDTNGLADIFVHDRNTGVTTRVSVDSAGNEGNGGSFTARISADGKFVAFVSDATNLVSGDTNAVTDVFRHDLTTGETIRLSLDSAGVECNGTCTGPWNNEDGRFTAFYSTATNLVANDTNGFSDVFLRDSCFPASFSNYGAGWPGTNGVPTLTSSAPPVLGTTITVTLSNSAGVTTPAVVILGFDDTNIPTSKGGSLLVVPFLFIPLSVPPAGVGLTGDLPPMDPALCGFEVDLQGLELDSGASKGMSFTDGLQLILGN
jgi:hypothetical protein